jgi:hypothetical protein
VIKNSLEKAKNLVPVVLAATALSACVAASGPLFTKFEPVAEGTAEIYLYRVSRFFGGAMHYKVTGLPMPGADQKAYDVPNASWRRIVLPPGTYSLTTGNAIGTTNCGNVQVALKAGSTVYLEMEGIRTGTTAYGQFAVGCIISAKTRDEALIELPQLMRMD